MDAETFRRLSSLFERTRGLPVEERAAYVDSVAADDPAVGAKLRELVEAHDDESGILGEEEKSPPPSAGERFGPFRLQAFLGDGGMGAVHRALAEEDGPTWSAGATVALKLLHPWSLDSPRRRARFERETALGTSLVHANVVRTFGGGAVERDGRETPFLVMEFVEGQTLRQLHDEMSVFPEELCRHIAREIAKGLDGLHRAGVVHRDVKPENVIVTNDHCVKLMDLGVALAAGFDDRLSATGGFAGTVAYAAPEQLMGKGTAVDGRADLFALGTLLYELVSGTHPFRADDVTTTLARIERHDPPAVDLVSMHVSPFFSTLIDWLMAKRPDERADSAKAVLDALDEGEGGEWWRLRQARRDAAVLRRRIRVGRDTAVHGREEELAALGAAFDEAAAGRGRVVLLTGEAGIGKSRLLDEFVAALRRTDRPHVFLYGAHAPGVGATESGLRNAFRGHLERAGERERLASGLADRPGVHAAFFDFVDGTRSSGAIDEAVLASSLVAATRLIAEVAAVVFVIDDLHFAGDAGRALFSSIAAATRTDRILVVGTARPDVPTTWVRNLVHDGRGTQIDLRRLGPKDLAALLREAFRSERLATELALRVAEKTDGNPYFVVELVRALRDRGLVASSSSDRSTVASLIGDLEVPATVRDAVAARLADLEDSDRELLDVAACIGFDFDAATLADVQQQPLLPVLRALARIGRRHRLVRAAGERFEFDHHQVQEVLYEDLAPALRRALHAQIGDALEPTGSERNRAAACRHLFLGGEGTRAVGLLDEALERLERRGATEYAERLCRQAVEAPGVLSGVRRVDVLGRWANLLSQLGRNDEAVRVQTDAADLAGEEGDVARALAARLARAETLRRTGELDPALTEFGAVREEAATAGLDTLQTDALFGSGRVLALRNRFEDALERFAETRARAEAEGRPRVAVEAAEQMTSVSLRFQRFEPALGLIAEALPLARTLGQSRTACRLEMAHAIVLRSIGSIDASVAAFEACIDSARRLGDRRLEAAALGNLAGTFARIRRLREALPLMDRVVALFTELGEADGTVAASLNRTNILGQLGRYPEALEETERGLAISRRLGDDVTTANLLGAAGSVHHELGRCAEAAALHRERVELLAGVGHRQFETFGRADLADCLAALGRLEEAEAEYRKAVELADEIEYEIAQARVRGSFASFLADVGKVDEAAEHATYAATHGERLGDLSVQALGLVVRGIARGDKDDLARAVEVARSRDLAAPLVVATAHLTSLREGEVTAALGVFREYASRLDALTRVQVLDCLASTSGDAALREERARTVDEVLNANPEACRETMRAHSPRIRAALT